MSRHVRNILFVIPGKNTDSPQSMSFAKRLANAIASQGPSVDIFMVGRTFNPFAFLKQGFDLRSKIRNIRPDVIVAQYGTFTGFLVAVFAPRPKIVTFRGTDINPAPTENRFYVFMEHLTSHIASFLMDGIICVSQELKERLYCRNQDVAIIPSSTDIELFRPLNQVECRNKLEWEVNKPIAVFFVGNNPRIKRLDMALEIQKTMTSHNELVELKIIREEVPLPKMSIYLNAADCLVFLSNFEGSPNLIREACACNTPVVTVAVGDVSEVLREVMPSKIVERDIQELTNAIYEVAMLRTRSNGREHVQQFSNEVTAKRTIEFYTKIIEKYWSVR